MRALPGEKKRAPKGPGPRPLAKDAASLLQRGRILDVATELIAKRGYQETTTELIVQRAKVGWAGFYKQFPDKEACFMAVFEEGMIEAQERLAGAYRTGEDTPWAERVAAAIVELFAAIVENPARSRVCFVESLSAGPIARARYESGLADFAKMLEHGRLEKEGGELLPDTVETTIAGGVMWIAYQLLIVGKSEELPEHLAEAIQFALSPYLGEAAAVKIAAAHRVKEPV